MMVKWYGTAVKHNPLSFVIKHELTHFGETNKDAYKKFVRAVKNSKEFEAWLRKQTGSKTRTVDQMIADLAEDERETREKYGIKQGPAENTQEVYANFVGDMLFEKNGKTLDSLINELDAKQRPAFIQFIVDFLHWLQQKISGNNDFSFELQRLESKYVAMLKSAQKAAENKTTTSEGGGKHRLLSESVIDLSNNNELSQLIGEKRGTEKYKIIQEYILENLGEQPITLSDGKKAVVDKSDARHISQKAGNKKTAQISEIKKIVENAQLIADENSTKERKFDYFYYYEAHVKFGKDTYPIYLNVGRARNDSTYHIYDITQKLRDTARRINGVGRPVGNALESDISKHSIPNSAAAVKERPSKISGKDSAYMRAVENEDTETAQRMVDEAAEKAMPDSKVRNSDGALMVTYHGTEADDFYTFDKARQGQTDSSVFGKGYYFTNDYEYSSDFGDNVRRFYLNITNPFVISRVDAPASEIAKKLKAHKIKVEFDYTGMVAYEFARKFGNQRFSDTLQSLRYDGVIVDEGFECVVFDRNQMKSADPVTYDNDGNVIPLSERFDEEKVDVRYSVRTNRFVDFDKPITLDDVRTLRSIGRKSINKFTPEDIEKAQKWAHKFYQQLGTKSPFFRRWFGDWRAYEHNSFVNVLKMERREGKNPRGSYKNKDTGWSINSSSVGYDETTSHSGKDKKSIIAMRNIDTIIENAVLFDTEVSEYGRGKKSIYTAFMHKFYAPISIDGKTYIAKMAVDESHAPGQSDTNKKFYHVRAIEIETASSVGIGKSHTPIIEDTVSNISISDLFNLVKVCDSEFKPKPVNEVLIENGRPKTFYHGTNEKFTEFSPDEFAQREGSFFFAENKEDAAAYGDNVFEVYLTGKKLADYDNQPSEFYQLRDKRQQVEYLKQQDYDGWYADMDSDGWGEISVFSPEQIKSAKDGGNIGTFSEAERDIRYSVPTEETVDYTAEMDALDELFKNGEIDRDEYRERINELYEQAGKAHGTIPKGETVTGEENFDDPVPKSVDGKKKVRQYVRTVIEGGELTEDMLTVTKQQILSGDLSYEPTSEEKNMQYAERALKAGTADAIWQKIAQGEEAPNAGGIAIGETLLKLAVERKDTVEVVKLVAELSEVGTRMGQSIQALSLLKRMTGIGQLYYVRKSVDLLNRDLEKKLGKDAPIITIDETLARQLAESETAEDFDITYGAIINHIASQVPSTFLDKWNAWRYMAMLFNPTTHIRNLYGNGIFCPAVKLKDTIAATLEQTMIKDSANRTKSVVINKEYKSFAKDDFENIKDVITSGGKMNPKRSIADNKPIFKTKVLEAARKFNFDMLEAEDAIFLKAHYIRALGGYLQARKIDIRNVQPNVLAKAREYAILEAQKATYRDASALANVISSLSSKSTVANVLVEGVLPFKKTPINIIKRGVEYSPFGLLKTIFKGSYDLKKGNITASQWIDGLASGLTGTAITALGMALASIGIVKGGFDDDEEDRFNKMLGMQEYSVEIFGYSYTIDWAAPACMPFFMGVSAMESIQEEGNLNTFSSIVNAFGAGLEPFINLSMLSGIQDTISAARYSDADDVVQSVAKNIVSSYFSQALPSIGGKLSNIVDPVRRSNYIDKTSPLPEWVQSALNTIGSKIPFLSQNKPEYINAWGEGEDKGGVVRRFFQSFLSPGYLSDVEVTEIDAEIKRLAESTGDQSVFPDAANKYIKFKGVTKHLSADEYVEYATNKGQMSAEYIREFINHPEYNSLTDEQKVETIGKLYGLADAKAKAAVSYTFDEVSAMSDGVISGEKYEAYNAEQQQSIVDNYFLGGQYKALVRLESSGGSAVEYYINGSAEPTSSSGYSASDVNMAFDLGDTELAFEMIGDIVKDKTENYINKGEKKTDAEKKAKSSVKSSMTSYWKPLYLEANKNKNYDEMRRIREILYASGLYDNKNAVVQVTQNWIKSSKK